MLAGLGNSYRKLGVGLGHRSSLWLHFHLIIGLQKTKYCLTSNLLQKLGQWPVLWTDCLTFKAIYNRPGMYDLQYLRLRAGQSGKISSLRPPGTTSPKSSKQPQIAKYFLLLSRFISLGNCLKIFKAKIGLPLRFLERFVLPLGISRGRSSPVVRKEQGILCYLPVTCLPSYLFFLSSLGKLTYTLGAHRFSSNFRLQWFRVFNYFVLWGRALV